MLLDKSDKIISFLRGFFAFFWLILPILVLLKYIHLSMDVPGYALVAGAASGIGKAVALGFAREGSAGIALIDLNAEALEAVKSDIMAACGDKTPKILIFPLDISVEADVEIVVTEAATSFGRLDYLVNTAGVAMKHPGGAAFCETKDWDRVLGINLNGTFFLLRAVAKIMLKQEPIISSISGRALQKGSIVNFSSIQGLVGITLSTAYAVSKTAVIGLTRTASEDYAHQGLRINCVCPGYTETPLTTKNPDVFKAMQERVATAVPMQRMGQPEEIADGALYLAGGRSSFVTGTALIVDGGYTCR